MRTRKISKGRHEHRTVYCPSPEEKKQLRCLLPELNKIEREMAERFQVGHVAHAFVADRNQVTCAMRHIGFPATYCFDLTSWFGSITTKQLIDAGVPERIANMITVNGSLPQGFPTSPVAANIVGVRFDVQVMQQLRRMEDRYGKFSYTRYADDLHISWSDSEDTMLVAICAIDRAVNAFEWRVKQSKTAFYRAAKGKRIICGVAVDNIRVGPTRHTKRKLRAARRTIAKRGRYLTTSLERAYLRSLENWAACKVPKRCHTPIRRIHGLSGGCSTNSATPAESKTTEITPTPGSSRRLFFGG